MTIAADAAHAVADLDGAGFGPLWALPFAGMLLSIAVMPLLSSKLWHHHFAKFALFWGAAILVPLIGLRPFDAVVHSVGHTILLEYIPFVLLLGALFVVAGGIRLTGRIGGTPGANTGALAFGAAIASLVGTTGAAMLLVRPLIIANKHRRNTTHVFVFFIFLVANIGGALTPLGDPPLFLGFLAGVDFFWFTRKLATPMLFCSVVLLVLFYALERFWFFPREAADLPDQPKTDRITIQGGLNLLLLMAVLGSVLLSGLWHPDVDVMIFGTAVPLQGLARDGLLLVIGVLSLRLTPKSLREANGFDWFPIKEVAILFLAIFTTMIPVLAMLKAGHEGPLGGLIALTEAGGVAEPWRFFWITGVLSSVLDNAPTFLVFFNVAGGNPAELMTDKTLLLEAISAGAVFMGALTYIGNAPNFLVRSIAEHQGIRMPSFFGYVVWSATILLPVFAVATVLFFL